MSRALNDLAPAFRPVACELIARAIEARIMVMIIDTRRTAQEQADYLARGVSWTLQSKHLTGNAIDLCPYEVFQANGPDKLGWDEANPLWPKLGAIGQALGLKWGVVFRNGTRGDLGHFELEDT